MKTGFVFDSPQQNRLDELRARTDGLRRLTLGVHGPNGFPNLEVLDLSSNEF